MFKLRPPEWDSRIKASLCVAAAVVLWTAQPGGAQPLEAGFQVGPLKYFRDADQAYYLDSSRKLQPVDSGESVELVKPSTWNKSLVLLGTDRAQFLAEGSSPVELAIPGKKQVEHLLWNDLLVLYREGPNGLMIVDSSGRGREVLVPGRVGAPIAAGDHLVVLTDRSDYFLISTGDLEKTLQAHPFPRGEVQALASGSEVLLWSAKASRGMLAVAHKEIAFPQPPNLGAKSVDPEGWALLTDAQLGYLSPTGQSRFAPRPDGLTADALEKATVFLADGALQLVSTDAKSGVMNFAVTTTGEALVNSFKDSEVKAVVPLTKADQPHFLFAQTSLEEPKTDDSGHPVIDPKTDEPATHSVKGTSITVLEGGRWKPVSADARARLVGPCQMVGSVVLYATQTEPPHQAGNPRTIDHRYPYPQVVLHAIDAQTGLELWKTDLPRGKSPSAARVPEDAWPVLADGKLLFVAEDSSLTALDTGSGKVLWNSLTLPLDESKPLMLDWGNTLGLVATDSTIKTLILINTSDGSIQDAIFLNPFFDSQRLLHLLGISTICLALLLYIYVAGKRKLFIRRIAGLEALDEAVGRATEMGKPVLYVTGLADVDDIQTLAALSILSHVSKKTADYDSSIIATTSRAVTFSAAQEVVRDAFTVAGRPDSFSVESVQYISDDQFGYAAGVDGIMLREKPAANFYMGNFFAESLIFAETGYATGAIQIAGTAQVSQLPFFVAACDYTLIGEELFAASAYLSGDPLQVGSLRGQDVGKAIVMVFLVLASLDATFGAHIARFLGGFFA